MNFTIIVDFYPQKAFFLLKNVNNHQYYADYF